MGSMRGDGILVEWWNGVERWKRRDKAIIGYKDGREKGHKKREEKR